jgi:hypothetical protein
MFTRAAQHSKRGSNHYSRGKLANKLLTKPCNPGVFQRAKPTESPRKINRLRFPTGLQNLSSCKGGLARAGKHSQSELSRWAKLGGRPVKNTGVGS